jgi:hypothetical protein
MRALSAKSAWRTTPEAAETNGPLERSATASAAADSMSGNRCFIGLSSGWRAMLEACCRCVKWTLVA